MIGRGTFKAPWLINPHQNKITIEERIRTLKLHLDLFEKNWGINRPFSILRRFFKIYISDFCGASEFRNQMMQVSNFAEAREVIDQWEQSWLKTTNSQETLTFQ
jgi:tRNA-dihydrouridine synthase